MRRQIPLEPWSEAALWSRRVAVFAATVALLSLLLVRLHIIDPASALASLGGAVGLALIALLLFGVACVIIWTTGRRGIGAGAAGAAGAAAARDACAIWRLYSSKVISATPGTPRTVR